MNIKKFINLAYKAVGYKNFGLYEIENMEWSTGKVAGVSMDGKYVDDNNITFTFEKDKLTKINGKPFKKGM